MSARAERRRREREERKATRKVLRVIQDVGRGRRCGECNVCCVDLEISEMEWDRPAKEAGVPCESLRDGRCGCYAERPGVCRKFACGYLLFPNLFDEEDRPDRSGLLVYPNSYYGPTAISTLVVRDDFSAQTLARVAQLENWMLERGFTVVRQQGDKAICRTPAAAAKDES